MTMFTEKFTQMFRDWDKLRDTSECLHCHGSGLAPGDGSTECGFCEEMDEAADRDRRNLHGGGFPT